MGKGKYRLSNQTDFVAILPLLLENPKSRPTCNRDRKNHSVLKFFKNSYDTYKEHLTKTKHLY